MAPEIPGAETSVLGPKPTSAGPLADMCQRCTDVGLRASSGRRLVAQIGAGLGSRAVLLPRVWQPRHSPDRRMVLANPWLETGKSGDATCLPSNVPSARTSLLERAAPSRAPGPGASRNCLPSFSALRRLRHARSPPRSEIPTLLAPVGRHRYHTIERHHSSPTGVSHP